MNNNDSIIFKNIEWKTVKIRICKNPMPLWLGINAVVIECSKQRKLTDEEWKDIVLNYPFDTEDCRCKPCRFRRWFGPKISSPIRSDKSP